MKIFFLILVLTPIIIISPVKGKDIKSNSEKTRHQKNSLSFTNYIEIIREKLPELKKNKLIINRAKSALTAAKGIDDFNVELGVKYEKRKEYTYDPTYENDYARGYAFKSGINKTFSLTGTRISTGFEYSRIDVSGSTTAITGIKMGVSPTLEYGEISSETRYYQPLAYIGFSQPLLFNAFGLLDRFARNDAKMKLEIERLREKELKKIWLNYYQKLYFEWIIQKKITLIIQDIIKGARRLSAQVRRKFRAGLADNDDFQKTRANIFKYQELLEQSKILYDAITNELGLFFDSGNNIPITSEFDIFFDNSIKSSFASVPFEKTRNQKILHLTQKNLKYIYEVSSNKMLPTMNLVGNIGIKSRENEYSESFSQMDDKDYSIGLIFTYPLGNNKNEGDIQRVKTLRAEMDREYEITKNKYERNIKDIATHIARSKNSLTIKGSHIASLRSRYRTETKKYNQARLDLSFLIQTENNLASEMIDLLKLKKRIIDLSFDYRDLIN